MLNITLKPKRAANAPAMRFLKVMFADVSTNYLLPTDLEILASPLTPMRIAALDGGTGSMFLVPETEELLESTLAQAKIAGLSDQFCQTLRELHNQEIPYALFDVDGGSAFCDDTTRCLKCSWVNAATRPQGCISIPVLPKPAKLKLA